MRHGFLRVIDLEDARMRLERVWSPSPRVSMVPPWRAINRTTAGDVLSAADFPPFSRASYDGYAVVASDTFGADEESPKEIALRGEIRPGTAPRLKIRRGICARISTGAQMPAGADAVVMQEHASEDGKKVLVRRAVAPGENVSRRGSDVRRGEVIVKKGVRLNPAHIGAMVATGVRKVPVLERPRVAVISTGDELVRPGGRLGPGKIYDSNGCSLAAAVLSCGGDPIYMGICGDREGEIRSILLRALKKCDMVIISGGTSAGPGDLIPKIIKSIRGAVLITHGLAQKPGKPALAAVAMGKPIFGLPGYPVSALMVFDRLVADQIRGLSGTPRPKERVVTAVLASKIISVTGRRELVPVKLERRGSAVIARPVIKDSGAIASLSMADGYVEIPLEREMVEAGERVEVKMFAGDYAC
ncbi:MAG: molybdopterin-binding protein [Candidatus Hadarchaeales archaeon]